jgi:hypothetical protein
MDAEDKTIVFIHGLWMTARCWENWVDRYAAAGYRVINRSWPGLDGDIEEVRRNPEAIANLGITGIVDHYESIIRELSAPPSSSVIRSVA